MNSIDFLFSKMIYLEDYSNSVLINKNEYLKKQEAIFIKAKIMYNKEINKSFDNGFDDCMEFIGEI